MKKEKELSLDENRSLFHSVADKNSGVMHGKDQTHVQQQGIVVVHFTSVIVPASQVPSYCGDGFRSIYWLYRLILQLLGDRKVRKVHVYHPLSIASNPLGF